MKKNFLIQGVSILIIVFSLFFNRVEATTGGPYVVYDLKYNPITKLVYFLSADQGGRGCPSELKSISLVNGELSTLYSCDDAEKQAAIDGDFYFKDYLQKINLIVENLDFAKLINLRKNNIRIETNVVKVKECTEDTPWLCGVDFMATVFQDNVKKAEIPFSGCNVDQPLIVDGYSLPGVTDKIILIFSRKGLCYEGGYILESLHVISDIKILDEGYISSYKTSSPLLPHEGSLFVYINTDKQLEKEEILNIDNNKIEASPNKDYKTIELFATAVAAILLGIFLGRISKKQKITQ